MLYKNNGGNTDNANTIDNNENAWKYWLLRAGSQPTAEGYYLTQENSTLYLKYYVNQNDTRSLASFDVSNNTTYAIRVQRLKRGSQYVWHLFVDSYSSTTKEAKTDRGVSYETSVGTYVNSSLLVSATTADRFIFDELKMYSMKLSITGANSAANGIALPVYAGQQNAPIYGFKVEARGYFDLYQVTFNTGAGLTQIVESANFKKSFDSYFGNNDDVSIVNLLVDWSAFRKNDGWGDTFYSIGNADGSMTVACYYYVSANIQANPSSSYSLSFASNPIIQSANAQLNFVGTPDVMLPKTTATIAGKGYDWVGGISNAWNNKLNWSPNTEVPGANDVAKVGVITFTNQPTVTATTTVGNVILGNTKSAYLSVNANQTLTVNGTLTVQGGSTLDGSGILNVNGNIVAGNTTGTGIEVYSFISTLNTNSLVLNSANANSNFTSKGASLNIKESILTTSASNQSRFTLASTSPTATSILTFTGATPLVLSTGNTIINFSADNATVEYAGTTAQKVYTDVIPNLNGSLSYKNIKFTGAGVKTVADGNLLVAGDWNSTGGKVDMVTNNTVLSFNSTKALASNITGDQAINDAGSDSGTGLVFKQVNFSGGGTKTLSATGKFSLGTTGVLTMGTATSLVTSANLTLKSDAASTATVAEIPASASIIGKVTVERYVQGGPKSMFRTYRMLSSPVYDNIASLVTANAEGDRTYSFTQFIDDMIITGSGGAANGFDATSSNSASAFTYNSNFIAVTNINTNVNVGRGSYLFYRGNRDANTIAAKTTGSFVDPESTVVTFKGYLNQQDVAVSLTYGTASNNSVGFNLLGNPYASAIDWNSPNLVKTNINATCRIWNPAKRQYSTYNGAIGVNGGDRYIASGQAFFVQASNANSSIIFKESAKVTSTTQPTTMLLSTPEAKGEALAVMSVDAPSSLLRIMMKKDQAENSDESVIVLKKGSVIAYSSEDVTHLNGEEVFLSTLSSDQKQLAINYVPEISNVNHVGLNVTSTSSGNFSLKFNLEEVPTGYAVQLVDRYTNSTAAVTENFVYPLAINKADTSSFGTNRFVLLFSPPVTLPVTISTFTANKVINGVVVKWVTATEVNNNHFEVERAGDDNVFISLGKVAPKGAGDYSFIDKSPLSGNNYYRLTQYDNDGQSTTNKPVVVKFTANLDQLSAAAINIYPNPVVDNFTVKYNGSLTSDLNIVTLLSPSGQVILSKTVAASALINGYNLNVSAQATGVYMLSIKDGANSKNVGSLKMIKL